MQLTSGGPNGALRAPSLMRRLQLILVLGRLDGPTAPARERRTSTETEVIHDETLGAEGCSKQAVAAPAALPQYHRNGETWRRLGDGHQAPVASLAKRRPNDKMQLTSRVLGALRAPLH